MSLLYEHSLNGPSEASICTSNDFSKLDSPKIGVDATLSSASQKLVGSQQTIPIS